MRRPTVLSLPAVPARWIGDGARGWSRATARVVVLVAAWAWPGQVRGQDSVITLPDAQDRLIQAQGLFVQGLTRSWLGDDAGAIERFERAAQLAPQAPAIHSALATAWTRRGDESAAVPYARRAFELDSSRAEYGIDLALLLARTGDAPAAVGLLDRRAASHPDEWATLVERARLLASLEQRTRAADAYRALHDRWVLPDEQLEEAIAIESSLGNGSETLALLDELAGRRPLDASLARRRGETLVRLGRVAEALRAFERAVAIDPLDAEARAAIQALAEPSGTAQASDLDPFMALVTDGRALDAASGLAELADRDPSRLDVWQALVVARRAAGDPVAALDAVAEARLFFPGDVELALQSGIAALEALLPLEAQASFETARALAAEQAASRAAALSEASSNPANRAEAGAAMPGWTTAGATDAVIAAGLAAAEALDSGRPVLPIVVAAISSLRSAGIDMGSPAGFSGGAALAQASTRPSEAVPALEALLSARPRSPLILVALADLLASRRESVRARSLWEAARALVPASPVIRQRLGER